LNGTVTDGAPHPVDVAVIFTVPEKSEFQVKTPVSQLITPAELLSIDQVTLFPDPGSE
jgi:hypothetical protein